jgi:hypothetical protein
MQPDMTGVTVAADCVRTPMVGGVFSEATKYGDLLSEFKKDFKLSSWQMAKLAFKMVGTAPSAWQARFAGATTSLFGSVTSANMVAWMKTKGISTDAHIAAFECALQQHTITNTR